MRLLPTLIIMLAQVFFASPSFARMSTNDIEMKFKISSDAIAANNYKKALDTLNEIKLNGAYEDNVIHYLIAMIELEIALFDTKDNNATAIHSYVVNSLKQHPEQIFSKDVIFIMKRMLSGIDISLSFAIEERLGDALLKAGQESLASDTLIFTLTGYDDKLSENDADLSYKIYRVASIINSSNKTDELIKFLHKLENKLTSQLPSDDPSVTTTREELALSYLNIDYAEAKKCALQAMTKRRQTWISDGANLLREKPIYAHKYYGRSLIINQLADGGNDQLMSDAGLIAGLYAYAGYKEEMISIYNTLAVYAEKWFGTNYKLLGEYYSNISSLYWSMGNNEKALSFGEKGRKVLDATWGNHPAVIKYEKHLSEMHIELKNYAKAEEILRNILKIINPLLVDEHISLLYGLSFCLLEQQKYSDAIGYLDEAARIANTYRNNYVDLLLILRAEKEYAVKKADENSSTKSKRSQLITFLNEYKNNECLVTPKAGFKDKNGVHELDALLLSYLDTASEYVTELTMGHIQGFQINNGYNDKNINIYIVSKDKDDKKYRLLQQYGATGQCAYVLNSNTIICDSMFVNKFQSSSPTPESRLEGDLSLKDALNGMVDALATTTLLWVVGHEIGHLAHEVGGTYFETIVTKQIDPLNEKINLTDIDRKEIWGANEKSGKEEYLADIFALQVNLSNDITKQFFYQALRTRITEHTKKLLPHDFRWNPFKGFPEISIKNDTELKRDVYLMLLNNLLFNTDSSSYYKDMWDAMVL